MARRSRAPPKLPVQQLAILAICRFAEPVAMTSVYPYLPEMIESFGVEQKDVAKWAGRTSAVFSLAQSVTAVMWGRASDKWGRKPTIMAGLTMTMAMSVLWGLSTSLPMAITVRAVAGACNGNVGIIRTMVAEMVPQKELQPRAFSLMPLIWSLGSIFGPSFGGFFAKPAENMPGLFGNSWLLTKFPFLLPNLVAAALFLIGITTGILFLRETLETRRYKKDYGRALGKRLVTFVKAPLATFTKSPKHHHHHHHHQRSSRNETSALLQSPSHNQGYDSETSPLKAQKPSLPRPTLSEVFTRQSTINLIAYTLLALHAVAYDQLLSIFLHHPSASTKALALTSFPLKFAHGFGLNSTRIGTIFTLSGILGCLIQFLLFPPLARHFGILPCLKACAIAFPLINFATPFTALLPTPATRYAALLAILLVKSFAVIFAFPCSIILLTNSATSLRILGTLNGFAVAISAVGRAIGPAIGGAAFSWGVERGYIVTPYFLLGSIAMIGAIPVWYLVEMEGFEKVDDDSSSSNDDDDDADESEDTANVRSPDTKAT